MITIKKDNISFNEKKDIIKSTLATDEELETIEPGIKAADAYSIKQINDKLTTEDGLTFSFAIGEDGNYGFLDSEGNFMGFVSKRRDIIDFVNMYVNKNISNLKVYISTSNEDIYSFAGTNFTITSELTSPVLVTLRANNWGSIYYDPAFYSKQDNLTFSDSRVTKRQTISVGDEIIYVYGGPTTTSWSDSIIKIVNRSITCSWHNDGVVKQWTTWDLTKLGEDLILWTIV